MYDWNRKAINDTIERLTNFYHDSSKGYFTGSGKIEDYTSEEKYYFDSQFSLERLVGATKDILLNKLLLHPDKLKFVSYLLRSNAYAIEVNSICDGHTVFELLVERVFELNDHFQADTILLELFKKGYTTKPSDDDYIRKLYAKVDTQERLVIWCIARFANVLNDENLLEKAYRERSALFTIVSFKFKKPVGIGYPTMLGIANNAFLHYRTHGDILLKAMKKFGVYDEVIKKDHKRSFRHRLEEFEACKPIQDKEFEDLMKRLFIELNS